MDAAIKTLGLFTIKLALHPEVSKKIVVNVARSLEEAKMQLDSGKAVITNLNEESQEETSQLTTKVEVENNNDEFQGDKDDNDNVQ